MNDVIDIRTYMNRRNNAKRCGVNFDIEARMAALQLRELAEDEGTIPVPVDGDPETAA